VSYCYHTGYVTNGVLSSPGDAATKEGVCPSGPPYGRTWYTLAVSVRRHQAQLYLNGRELVRVLPYHPVRGAAGLVLLNGFKNIVISRRFFVSPQQNDVGQ